MVSLSDAVKDGRLEGLYALRDQLAHEIENGPGEDVKVSPTAALARQLRDTLKEIAELEKSLPRNSVVDDLAAKRAARRAKSPRAGRAEGAGG